MIPNPTYSQGRGQFKQCYLLHIDGDDNWCLVRVFLYLVYHHRPKVTPKKKTSERFVNKIETVDFHQVIPKLLNYSKIRNQISCSMTHHNFCMPGTKSNV